ncbi:UNVERIFIED_CONTAM: hypothetical protein GTU68_045305 [Idotea baltica]|nr:hypothetical protein [Idotea baltica]
MALNGISFNVSEGEIYGIIGSNGAGKSTLLNVLAGVLPPSNGFYKIKGELDSLRSLGAGFDSELNAIENIYLYCSLRGRKKDDITKHIPKILEFAELEKFATTPIKYYSSGMYARLGFSVALDQKPDVLLVDEVLAVGDDRFQKKCSDVFKEYLKTGKTVIIVSHDMATLQNLCTKAAVLANGKLVFEGDPKEAIDYYRQENYETRLTS